MREDGFFYATVILLVLSPASTRYAMVATSHGLHEWWDYKICHSGAAR